MHAEELTSLEALAVAIRTELDTAGLYHDLAGRLGPTYLHGKVELLAREELQHKELLEDFFHRQFRGVPLILPDSQLPREICTKQRRDQLSVRELLACAIEQERRARAFYLSRVERVADPVAKRMYRFLADWELTHQMELTAEYEMVALYPYYFEVCKRRPSLR